ncbi:MAG TPA: hypothetical protein DEA63_03600, partial [Firmicutes bacterium]|nr:hypothetical protein [Bacillota bacterium]
MKKKRFSTLGILNKKLCRQTLSGWKQFLSIIAMGGIAMTLFVGLLSNAQSLSRRVETFYQEGNLPSIWVLTKEHESNLGEEFKLAGILDEEDQTETRFQIYAKVNSSSCYGAIVSQRPTLSKPVEMIEDESPGGSDFFYIDKGISAADGTVKDPELNTGKIVALTYRIFDYMPGLSNMLEALSESNPEYFISAAKKNELFQGSLIVHAKITGIMTFPENIQSARYNNSTYLMSKSVFLSSFHEALGDYFSEEGRTLIESYLGIDLEEAPSPNTFPQDNELLVKLKDSSTEEAKCAAIKSYFADHETFGENNLWQLLNRSLNPWSSAVDTEVLE